MAASPTDGDQANSEPLKYKTWVLKVSIHCEGCKRKVKKILHSVEGVYMIDVNTRQHKVVVTGNVDANTLLRKLEKSGKHAELWPDSNHNQQNSNNNQEQQQQEQQQPNNNDQQQQHQNQNQNPNISVEEQQKEQPQKVADNSGQPQQQQQQPQQVKEVRFEGNIPSNGESQKPPANNGGGGGGGGGKKKKKKKGHSSNNSNNNGGNGNNNPSPQNNNNNNNNGGNGGGASAEQGANGGQQPTESGPPPQQNQSPNPGPGPHQGPEHMGPPSYSHVPSNRVYEYPPAYYAPPPVNAVNYNTAYPSSSYTASYYTAPPPYSYAYVHHGGGDVEPPAPLDWNPDVVPPSDTFEMFSDENPNACSIM